jgi:hypothetical protein
MTPEQKFTLWTSALTALPTIVFTGAVAFWTWRRDQERIIVQKSPVHWETVDGTHPDATLCGVGVVVRNLSLYPVRIAGLGFFVDGKTSLPFERDKHNREEWPLELASHARMLVYANETEWKRLEAFGLRDRIMDWQFVAVAVTETGTPFFSNRLSVRIMRPLRSIRRWFKKKRS